MELALTPIHRIVLGTHAVLAVWLVVNGALHQLGVLLGAWRGTLRHPEDLDGLLLGGAWLLVAGAVISWSLAGLARGATGLALVGLAVLAAGVAWMAARYGWTFLGGTTALGAIDLAAVLVLAATLPAR
jgi:hypothetical protein